MSAGGLPPPPGGDRPAWGGPSGASPAPGEPGGTGWGQPPPDPSHPGYGYPGGPSPSNGQATAALVLGIISLVCILLFVFIITVPIAVAAGIAAVITGILGLRVSRERGGVGRGQAIAGLVTGGVSLGLAAIGVVIAIAFFSWFETEFETNPFRDPEAFMTEMEDWEQRQRQEELEGDAGA